MYNENMAFLKSLTELGASNAPDSESIKKIILVNQTSVVFFFAAIPFMVSIYYVDLISLAAIVPIIMGVFILTLFLNKSAKYVLAKIVLYFTLLTSVYFFAATLGEHSGIQYVYLALIGFGFSIFDAKNKLMRNFLAIQPIILFFLLYVSEFAFFNKVDLTKQELIPIYITALVLIFIIIFLTMVFFDGFSSHYKKSLKDILLTYQLSEREGEVFLHILNGESNKSISKLLYIEEGTVKNHLTSIYKKLKVSTRSELMAKFTQ